MVTLIIALILVAAAFAVIFISERYRILFPFTIVMLSIPTIIIMVIVARIFPPSSIDLRRSVVDQVVTKPMGRSLKLSNGITIRCHEADEHRCQDFTPALCPFQRGGELGLFLCVEMQFIPITPTIYRCN